MSNLVVGIESELNFRDLTNKFTKQNSIASYEFESDRRRPTFVSLKFALFKSALNKDLLYYLLLKVLTTQYGISPELMYVLMNPEYAFSRTCQNS